VEGERLTLQARAIPARTVGYFAFHCTLTSVVASHAGGAENHVQGLLYLGCPGLHLGSQYPEGRHHSKRKVSRDGDGAKIAVFVGSNLYDLNGNFPGRLDAHGPCQLRLENF
jgi:hypothetical protein